MDLGQAAEPRKPCVLVFAFSFSYFDVWLRLAIRVKKKKKQQKNYPPYSEIMEDGVGSADID